MRLLRILEPFYRLGFFIVIFFKKFKTKKNDCSKIKKIISVGNLSVGGTGKSIFVKALVNFYKEKNKACAIFLRGYRRRSTKKKNFSLDPDFVSPEEIVDSGDEAMMLVQSLSVPVVVGKNRFLSLKLLQNYCERKNIEIDYVILDDAYQNYQLKKDFEFLLLDARFPFDNGHCLPAGRLREKDFSRADIIILTHADQVGKNKLSETKKTLATKISSDRIFCGKHSVCGVKSCVTEKKKYQDIKNRKFVAVAGIGSFSGFVNSLKEHDIKIGKFLEYADHFSYRKKDVEKIISAMHHYNCDGIITTQKDWEKLRLLVGEEKNIFYVLDIEFKFLPESERFFRSLNI